MKGQVTFPHCLTFIVFALGFLTILTAVTAAQLWQYFAFIAGLALIYMGSEVLAYLTIKVMETTLLSPRTIYWLYRLRVSACCAIFQYNCLLWLNRALRARPLCGSWFRTRQRIAHLHKNLSAFSMLIIGDACHMSLAYTRAMHAETVAELCEGFAGAAPLLRLLQRAAGSQ